MPSLDVSGLSGGIANWSMDSGVFVRAASAPAILLAILLIHSIYFFANRSKNGQQSIALDDLTRLDAVGFTEGGGLTVVRGDREQFDITNRSTSAASLPVRRPTATGSRRGPHRLNGAQTFRNVEVRQTIICDDDVTARDTTIFICPVKVSGDLIVEGHATFLQPVIVSGVLKVIGTAHFAAGVIAKRDALVRGSLTVGSDDQLGWAVVRELAIEQQLKLNGTLVADRAVELRKAA